MNLTHDDQSRSQRIGKRCLNYEALSMTSFVVSMLSFDLSEFETDKLMYFEYQSYFFFCYRMNTRINES